jgi:cell division protein FtsB
LSNLVEGMLVGRVGFGESFQACPASYSTEDSMAASIVRLECEGDELRAEVAMLKEQARILAEERDEARIQYRSTEALGMALVKTIDELKTEKADLFVQLVNLKAGSRRSTLDEIAESVREKYDERYEGEGMDNE